jgi:hypothetical protein
MNRRTALAITASSVGTVISGCLGGKRDDDFADPAADPFPIAVENAERGGAETFVSQTVDPGREYEDASMGCANEAYTAVREHLDGELDDTSHISIGRGRGPEGFDGIAITVSLTTAIYDRDGTLVEEADLEFEELVAVTPPTAHLQTEDGERTCAVPVYVEQAEMHID